MKTLIAVASFIGLTAGTPVSEYERCCAAQTPLTSKGAYTAAKEEPKIVTLKITGMTCAGCSSHVATTIKAIGGVIEQKVEYPGDVATIKYDAGKTSVSNLIKAIEKLGYKAQVQKDKKA